MKITIDFEKQTILNEQTGEKVSLYSTEGFKNISKIWMKVGWNEKHTYTFSWMGRPIIQLPEDMIRLQEAIFQIRPTVIVETGIAHGGSLIYSAGLMKMMDIKGRVIGVDIEIRPHNREAIEKHPLFPYITLIEGSSVDSEVVKKVENMIRPDDTVLVILDSNHLQDHVYQELEAYSKIVTQNSYIVATDGIMQDVYDVPRGVTDWEKDNPVSAVKNYLKKHSDFVLETPPWLFNESNLSENINTHFPDAWLKKIR